MLIVLHEFLGRLLRDLLEFAVAPTKTGHTVCYDDDALLVTHNRNERTLSGLIGDLSPQTLRRNKKESDEEGPQNHHPYKLTVRGTSRIYFSGTRQARMANHQERKRKVCASVEIVSPGQNGTTEVQRDARHRHVVPEKPRFCARIMVRPGGFDLPTFWFVGGKGARRQTTPADKSQQNQQITQMTFCSFWTVLYPVHGQFQRERLPGVLVDACFIWTRPRCLTTVLTGVFFNRTVSRLLSIEVGTASCTRSARERAAATCAGLAPRKWTLILVVALTPSKTPKFARPVSLKHWHSQFSGSSELAMHPQPFLHSHAHSPAPHFAIARLLRWAVKIVLINQVVRQSQALSGLAPHPRFTFAAQSS